MTAELERVALSRSCPFCGAPAGRPCVTNRFEDYRNYQLGNIREPHPQRAKPMIDADVLFNTARMMWSLTLSGRPTAHQTAAHEWMQAIAPGSLVAELSSRSPMSALERVGIVESIDPDNDAVTIICLDGSRKRWVNAEFVRLPRNDQDRAAVVNLANAM